MMPDSIPTLAELNRNISALRSDIAEHRREIGEIRKLETQVALNSHEIREAHERLDDLDGSLRWLMRLVIGAIVLALLGIVLTAEASPL